MIRNFALENGILRLEIDLTDELKDALDQSGYGLCFGNFKLDVRTGDFIPGSDFIKIVAAFGVPKEGTD